MRKQVFGRKLSRNTSTRMALFRSLVGSLVEKGSINTTLAKARAIAPEVDKIMTKVGQNSLNSKRLVLAKLANNTKVTGLLFDKYFESTKSRKSGFTRITKLGPRKGDRAQMARIEFVDKIVEEKKETKDTKGKGAKKEKITKKEKQAELAASQ